MISYTEAAIERAMKVEEVILRAVARKITWWQAAEIIGISDRQMRRWHERYQEFGIRGLYDRRRGRPSPKRVALAEVEKVLQLYTARGRTGGQGAQTRSASQAAAAAAPARRGSWRTMLGMLFLLVALGGGVLACGGGGSGGGGGGGSGNPGTTAGAYTVAVTGASGSLTPTTTLTVAVN